MGYPVAKNRKPIRFARMASWLINLSMLGTLGLIGWNSASFTASAAACDVITSASCAVTGIKTTTNTAYIYWKEKNVNGTMQFCYGIGNLSNCTTNVPDRGSANIYTLSGLQANTKYMFKFYGTFRTKFHYQTSGTFTTDGTVCGGPSTAIALEGLALSSSGDSLEGVVATATLKSSGAVIDVDTTNRSGQFVFELTAGEYVVSLAYANYTVPAPYTATLVAGTDLKIPNQILTGAFQISGTVVNKRNDSLEKATVTAYKKADNTVAAGDVTDLDGHYQFGLPEGTYYIKYTAATYGTATSADFTVTKSMELAKQVMEPGGPSGLRSTLDARRDGPGADAASAYDAKGTRLPAPASHRGKKVFATP
jgi:hypothetical protein